MKRVLPPKAKIKKGRGGGDGKDDEASGGGAEATGRQNSLRGKGDQGDQGAVMEEMARPNISKDVGNDNQSNEKMDKMVRKTSLDLIRKDNRRSDEAGEVAEKRGKMKRKSSIDFITPERSIVRRSSADHLFDFGDEDDVEKAAQDAMESGTLFQKTTDRCGSHGNGAGGNNPSAVVRFQVDDSATKIVDGMRPGASSSADILVKLTGGDHSGFGLRSGLTSVSSATKERKWSWWNKNVRRRDEYSILKTDFISEMRQLSKLRHPCITTVMGAVISSWQEVRLEVHDDMMSMSLF